MSDASLVNWSWASDGVAVLTLTSPPMNLLGGPLLRQLASVLDELAAQPSLRTLVVTGAGGRAFSAGADIKEFPSLAAAAAGGGRVAQLGQLVITRLATLPMPTLAAIDGLALGGGLELALACDLRLAGADSHLGLPEVGLGIFPCYGGTQRLPRLIGPAAAKELIFTGRLVTASEAVRLGLIDRMLPTGEALAQTTALASEIAGRAGLAVRAAKRCIETGLDQSLAAGLALEIELGDRVFASPDAAEGVSAFLAKRQPTFRHTLS